MLPESDIQRVITNILEREGGHSNDAADRGGDTYYGVTKPFAQQWNIPWPPSYFTAQQGYRRALAAYQFDQIPDFATLDLVCDSAVNHGFGRAAKWLQRALSVNDDGVIGGKTLAAIAAVPQGIKGWPEIYRNILTERILFYGAIVHNDPSQAVFINGWLNRAVTFLSPPVA